MSAKHKDKRAGAALLDQWRPPDGSGDPIGCLATTFTFQPELFEEYCLGRFLDLDSEPDKESLSFLLERESRLGGIYAGVLVDQAAAGQSHSLRWDILPVRVLRGKQHAKVSVLAWTDHVRILVASANITTQGYRTNQEVAVPVDLTPDSADKEMAADAIRFLHDLIEMVPGHSIPTPEVQRAMQFLNQVGRMVQGWTTEKIDASLRRQLVFTLPRLPNGRSAASSLESTLEYLRRRGGSPRTAWVASPFFDMEDEAAEVAKAMCKGMARRGNRSVRFCVPVHMDEANAHPRLLAPRAILDTALAYADRVQVSGLPEKDAAGNVRIWHAKMLALRAPSYSAVLVGSSNFTKAGLGVNGVHNVEANLLLQAPRKAHSRSPGQLEDLWPRMRMEFDDPDGVEWTGADALHEEEENEVAGYWPHGFLAAIFHAGEERSLELTVDPAGLDQEWKLILPGEQERVIDDGKAWSSRGKPKGWHIRVEDTTPPTWLLVRWDGKEGRLPVNVVDSSQLPVPTALKDMTAEDMLRIIAASDPGGALRAWAQSQEQESDHDPELDSATPIDLEPLRRYKLGDTFLHRIRMRVRLFQQLTQRLSAPVHGARALEWRLHGMIGVSAFADRLMDEMLVKKVNADEAVMSMADLMLALLDVNYTSAPGSLSEKEFERVFRPFMAELMERMDGRVKELGGWLGGNVRDFWREVKKQVA